MVVLSRIWLMSLSEVPLHFFTFILSRGEEADLFSPVVPSIKVIRYEKRRIIFSIIMPGSGVGTHEYYYLAIIADSTVHSEGGA